MVACPVSFTPRKSLFSYGGLMANGDVSVNYLSLVSVFVFFGGTTECAVAV